jgi:trehalose 6-phosphate phosphatase
MDRLPPFARAALLLDLDGTLIDIAPAPDLVVVEPGLCESLRRLGGQLGGAVAVVSGRPVEQIEALLGDAAGVIAGEHGGAIRFGPGQALHRPDLPAVPEAWRVSARRLAEGRQGAMVEEKARGFVLHYRAAPELGPELEQALRGILAGDDRFALLPAHMAWEVRPRGADKGSAVAALMARVPVAGRLPVFIGDDVTDEEGMAAARALGGAGLRVDEVFGSAGGVRRWLAATAEAAAWAALRG